MNSPFLSPTPTNPPAFAYAIPVPEAYQAWCLVAARVGCSGLQVLDVLALYKKSRPAETPMYLCEMLTRTTFEAALAMHFDGTDNLIDVWMRARIREYFGTELEESALQLLSKLTLPGARIGELHSIRLMPIDDATRPGCSAKFEACGIPELRRAQ